MKTLWIGLAALVLQPLLWTGGRHEKAAVKPVPPLPVRLTSSGDNLKPFVAARPGGGAYVAWARKSGEKATILFGRARDGAHLDSEMRVSLIGMHVDLGAENGPNVAVDAKGAIYVVWVAGSTAAPKIERLAALAVPDSGPNAPPAAPQIERVAAPKTEWPGTPASPPAAKAHGGGHPPRPGNLNIWLASSQDDGASFATPIRVNDDADGAEHRFPTVIADTQGGVCVTWLDKRKKGADGQEMARVYFARSTDGGRTFGANVDASDGQSYPICHCCRIGAACDAAGGLAIAFRNDIDDLRDMFLIRSTDAGRTFSAPAPLEKTGWKLPSCPMDGPSIGIDISGGVHAAWMTGANIPGIPASAGIHADESKVLYNYVAPGSAGAPKPTVLGVGHHPRLAVGRGGETYVIWHDGSIRLARIGTGEHPARWFLTPAGEKGGPSYPSIAVATAGKIYCAWQQLMPDDSVQIYLCGLSESVFLESAPVLGDSGFGGLP